MKKILIVSPFDRDANSFWRCMGPWSYLAKHSEGEYQIHVHQGECFWNTLDQYDLIFLHRPCRPMDQTILQIARNMNVPVWVDYDDWLFQLPMWNPNRASYHNPGIQHVIATCIACADIVTVSTPMLAKEFLPVNQNTVIVPNAYRSDLFTYRKPDVPERKDLFVWRGTNTHEGDLLSVIDGLKELKSPIQFLGGPSYSVLSQLKRDNFKVTTMADPILYWKNLYDLRAKVMLFPLYDDFFNHCKSNIAWIEAIHAGSLVVAPENMDQWKHPGVLSYSAHDSGSFADAAQEAMNMSSAQVKPIVADAYDYMRAKYDISVINNIRLDLLSSLFSPSFIRNKRNPYDQLISMWTLSVLKKEPLPHLNQLGQGNVPGGEKGNEKQSV